LTRRQFAASAAAAALGAQTAKRPNIVVIMADDMGFADIGCYGGEISTPSLDRLAKGGVRFTQFYNAARCCPSRASLLTGLYNHQAGVGSMIQDLGHPSYRGYLNENCVTIAEALRPAGYKTYMSGKWHVGEQRPHWPTDRGFDRYFGLISGASNYFKLDEGRGMAIDDKPFTPDDPNFYMTDAFTDHAVRFVEQHPKSSPFFLYLAYTAPHWPLHALPEDIAKYRGKYHKGWDKLRQERHARQVAMKLVDPKWGLSPRGAGIPAWNEVPESERDLWDLRMSVYAAQIDRMDRGIGRLMEMLDDNTIVLFLADNGGCHEEKIAGERPEPPGPAESFTSYGRAWANASNTPFRMYKHWVHEGGISSPLILHWPARMRRGGTFDRGLAHITDIMPTCLEAAGASYPAGKTPLAGKSLLAAAQGGRRDLRRTVVWEHQGNRAVRDGDWKLVAQRDGAWELYNVAADRCEMENLAAAQPGRVAQMSQAYDEWAAHVGAVPPAMLRTRR
jgi:arylsulfatase A-like enzyme